MIRKSISLLWYGIKKCLLFFTCFLLVYILACFTLTFIPVNNGFQEAKEGVDIFITSNGVHTDIVFPVHSSEHDWQTYFPFEHFASVDSTYHYVGIGWGDKGFFMDTPTWADLKFSTAFKAAFFLGTSAMHVTYRHRPVENGRCTRKRISRDQYRQLISAVKESFSRDAAQQIQHIDHPGYDPQDTFYEAKGTYSFLKTCNVWTGTMLREAGIRVSCWTPFDPCVFYYLK
jgi:uncharacterized protein (TIGR02117 family)